MAKGKPGRPKKTPVVKIENHTQIIEVEESAPVAKTSEFPDTPVPETTKLNDVPSELVVEGAKEPTKVEEEKEEVKSKATGIATYGIKNINRDGRAVVVCNKCTKEAKSLINNMCESCYNEWFVRSTTGRQHVG